MKDGERVVASSSVVSVRVWDLPVRVFHWLVVVLIAAAWITEEVGGNAMTYHMWIGYSVLALVLFRLVWGVVGSQSARFSDFVRGPGAVWRYMRGASGVSDRPSHGHNPAGGWSVVALLTCLLLQAATGLFANDEIAVEGPLAGRVGTQWSDWLTTIHRYNFNVLLALIGLHIAAVLFYLFAKRENLIVPMITGRKRVASSGRAEGRFVSVWLALIVMLLTVGIVALVIGLG